MAQTKQLFTLPPELRTTTYELLIPPEEATRVKNTRRKVFDNQYLVSSSRLLGVSRQVNGVHQAWSSGFCGGDRCHQCLHAVVGTSTKCCYSRLIAETRTGLDAGMPRVGTMDAGERLVDRYASQMHSRQLYITNRIDDSGSENVYSP